MRIKKVSETTPVQAQIVDGHSTSTTDGYSANYVNNLLEPVALWTGSLGSEDTTSTITLATPKTNFKRLRILYRLDSWSSSTKMVDVPVISGTQQVMLDVIYGWSGTTIQIREGVLKITNNSAQWDANRSMYRNLTSSAVSGAVAASGNSIAVVGIYGLVEVTESNDVSTDVTNVYSTAETRIGTWIDGKPLYRKVVTGTLPTTNYTAFITINNLDTLVSDEIVIDMGDSYLKIPFVNLNSDEYFDYYVKKSDNSYYTHFTASKYGGKPFTAIIEYTKTTD